MTQEIAQLEKKLEQKLQQLPHEKSGAKSSIDLKQVKKLAQKIKEFESQKNATADGRP